MPYIIYLRRGTDGLLERSASLTDNPQWLPTGLSETTIVDGPTPKRLEELFDEWSKIERLSDIEDDLDLRTQYGIGRLLCRALGTPPQLSTTDWLHLVPILKDETRPESRAENEKFLDLFCRIPWNMITREDNENTIFLARDPSRLGSITIDASPAAKGRARYPDVRLPPFPRVLLVVPTRANTKGSPTRGAEHLKHLDDALVAPYEKLGISNRIACVTTFDEFERILKDGIDGLAPHIVYFYGHAEALETTSAFLFDDPTSEVGAWAKIDKIEIALRECLRKLGNFPPAIWINACRGASAKRNSFLRSLAPMASTVLTTRTLAAVDDSRAVAEVALPLIAIEGQAPHSALRTALKAKMLPITSSRWATIVVSVQYGLWSALKTEERQVEDADSAGDFPSRLDRTSPLSRIEIVLHNHFSSAAAALRPPTPALLSIGWRGDGEQRIDMFEQRVSDLLQERLHQWPTISRRIELQLDSCPARGDDLTNHFLSGVLAGVLRDRAYAGMPVPNLTAVQGAIKDMIAKDTRAVFLEHGPFTSEHAMQISLYMKFWNDYFDALMPQNYKLALVLAFGFSEEPGRVSGSENEMLHTFVQLGPVAMHELTSHLTTFYRFYRFPEAKAAAKAEEYILDIGDSFRKLHAKLESLANISRWTQNLPDGGTGNERV